MSKATYTKSWQPSRAGWRNACVLHGKARALTAFQTFLRWVSPPPQTRGSLPAATSRHRFWDTVPFLSKWPLDVTVSYARGTHADSISVTRNKGIEGLKDKGKSKLHSLLQDSHLKHPLLKSQVVQEPQGTSQAGPGCKQQPP